jgi:hypothetical protein
MAATPPPPPLDAVFEVETADARRRRHFIEDLDLTVTPEEALRERQVVATESIAWIVKAAFWLVVSFLAFRACA